MRICLIAPEIFGYGTYGGFGAAADMIATGLAARGVDTVMIVPRTEDQPKGEMINGYQVETYDGDPYAPASTLQRFGGLLAGIDADIYHSIEASPMSRVAMNAAPDKKHMITLQAPALFEDWQLQWQGKGVTDVDGQRFFKRFMDDVRPAVRGADLLACQARSALDKCRTLYDLDIEPVWLPNPVSVARVVEPKQPIPTVCFLGRWVPLKRPELFLELAKLFPEVQFIAMGEAPPEFKDYDSELRQTYSGLNNLDSPGLTLGDDKIRVLETAWILINTSTTECMPVSFLEAAAQGCAILSHIDAEAFASRFGCHVTGDKVEDFAQGLSSLLDRDRCIKLGSMAYTEVVKYYALDTVLNQHLAHYERLIGNKAVEQRRV